MSKKNLELNGLSGCTCQHENTLYTNWDLRNDMSRPSLLLHSCCGPCSTAVIERLAPDYCIQVFYYNPCITDQEEYEKRKAAQIEFINAYNCKHEGSSAIGFIEGEYNPNDYLQKVKGHEKDLEGGERCTICFRMRLERTANLAASMSFDAFTTTLTVSPHKNYLLISEIGKEVAEKTGTNFLDMDFKKKAGFQRSIQLSKEYNLYRQNYCGCLYSKREL